MRLYENQSGLVHLVDGLYQSDRLSDLCIACNQSILVQNVHCLVKKKEEEIKEVVGAF